MVYQPGNSYAQCILTIDRYGALLDDLTSLLGREGITNIFTAIARDGSLEVALYGTGPDARAVHEMLDRYGVRSSIQIQGRDGPVPFPTSTAPIDLRARMSQIPMNRKPPVQTFDPFSTD